MSITPIKKTASFNDPLNGHVYCEEGQDTDKEHIRKSTNLPTMADIPFLDDVIRENALQVEEKTQTKKQATSQIRSDHSEYFDSNFKEKAREPIAEEKALTMQLKMNLKKAAELTQHMNITQKFYNSVKPVITMAWNRLEQFKFWSSVSGAVIATVFGIINVSRSLKANNLVYIDSSWLSVFLVSLIFVCPTLGVKNRYATLKNSKQKDQFIDRLFKIMLGSMVFFLLVFGYVNMPQQTSIDLFAPTTTSPGTSQLVHYLSLISQIVLELSTASCLMCMASKIYEEHVVVTDSNKTVRVCKSYDELQRQLQEVKRGEILINRRLMLLNRYFDEIESKKRHYIKIATTRFLTILRRL